MTVASDFLKAADTLAHGDTEGHWRRAVSTAYYCAFHCLVESAVRMVFAHPEAQRRARGWFEHREMQAVAHAVSSAPEPLVAAHPTEEQQISYYKRLETWKGTVKKYELTTVPSLEVRQLAKIFVTLQRRRQAADYFPPEGQPQHVLQTEARQMVNEARRFCELVAACEGAYDPYYATLVSEMLRASVKENRR